MMKKAPFIGTKRDSLGKNLLVLDNASNHSGFPMNNNAGEGFFFNGP